MIIVMAWYGACYYLDYFAYLALRKAIANGDVSPGASGAKNGNGRGDDGVIITASADENSSIDDDDDDDDEKSKIGFDYPLEDTDDDVAMTDSDVWCPPLRDYVSVSFRPLHPLPHKHFMH